MVLYRLYRPQKFSDIIGQEHIVQTLTHALARGIFGHGYLFSGPKGSGKTTLARIMAKALNCTGRKLGKDSFEPCNRCSSCKEITLGKSLDMIEIDAASNRGIDEIRDLRDKIRFAPTSSQYKIYIIDEVHMLTKEAFNALLKTLEEPPAHAIFIMATTEPQKILPTILSRVQRFDFHRATLEEITKLLNKIASKESIKIDDDAIQLLAQMSFGSYRDSLSLLGQIASTRETAASKVTLEQTQKILGLAQEKSVFDFIGYLAESDRKKAFKLISELYLQGVDLENFTIKLVEVLRKIALWKMGENQLFDLTKEQQSLVKSFAEIFDINVLMSMIAKFSGAIYQIKSANLPQLPLEMLVYEFTEIKGSREDVPSIGRSPEGAGVGAEAPGGVGMAREAKSRTVHPEATFKKTALNADLWPKIIQEARTHNHSLSALLRDAVLAKTEDDCITLAFKFKFHADMVANKKTTQIIEEIIKKITGKTYKVECIVDPELAIKKPTEPDEELLNGAKEVFEIEE